MATKKQLIYNYLDLLSKGSPSDDFLPSYAQLGFIIDTTRARLIKQDDERSWSRRIELQQDLGCIRMIPVDKAECCSLSLDCDVYRTEKEIPKLIRFKNKPGFTFTGAIDKVTRFDIILPERVPYISSSKYTAKVPRLYYLNNHLYSTTKDLQAIAVFGILERPEDARSFRCDNEACYTDESEYPLPLDMISIMTQYLMKEDLSVYAKMISDNENDAIHE